MTNEEMEITPAAALGVLRSGDITPWRDFRWRHGQTHYSGLYWWSTTGGHVAHESRLELARLLLADFDPQVGWILSQPFLIEATVSGQARRHVPDFALIDRHGLITIVNVKPASRLGDAKVAATLAWAGMAFGLRGWRHEVWTGAPEVVLANVRFLAGYRRRDRFEGALLDNALAAVAEPENRWRRGSVFDPWAAGGDPPRSSPPRVVGRTARRSRPPPVRRDDPGACLMTSWTTTLAIGSRLRYEGEAHTVIAIGGRTSRFVPSRGAPGPPICAVCWPTAQRCRRAVSWRHGTPWASSSTTSPMPRAANWPSGWATFGRF